MIQPTTTPNRSRGKRGGVDATDWVLSRIISMENVNNRAGAGDRGAVASWVPLEGRSARIFSAVDGEPMAIGGGAGCALLVR